MQANVDLPEIRPIQGCSLQCPDDFVPTMPIEFHVAIEETANLGICEVIEVRNHFALNFHRTTLGPIACTKSK